MFPPPRPVLTVDEPEQRKISFAGGIHCTVHLMGICEEIDGSDDTFLTGVGVGGQRAYIDHFPVVPPIVAGVGFSFCHLVTSHFCIRFQLLLVE